MAPALRVVCAVAILAAAPLPLSAAHRRAPVAAPSASVTIGENIYRFGRLPAGTLLKGERSGGVHATGIDAACVNCHRRSGLGSAEGRGFIPPITGQFLFHANTENRQVRDLPLIEGAPPNRDPYTDETLARAIRDGVRVDAKQLSRLRPRVALHDKSITALIACLKGLSAQ